MIIKKAFTIAWTGKPGVAAVDLPKDIQKEYGSFDRFIWAYVNHTPIINAPHSMAELPTSTPLSDQISKDLKKRGFKFVGSTIVYSFMQAVGMVDDHMIWCPWHTNNRK